MSGPIYLYTVLCLIYVALNWQETKASEILRPRGVSISKASLYNPEAEFVCFDGSERIPFSYVNDDYCDCQDGSDEPGTPACPNGTFHCTNAGHRPLNIPSSRVNDGICDCCDSSDEYNTNAQCISNCYELGKAARVEAQKKAELVKMGNELRLELGKRGKQLKKEKQERLHQLEKELDEAANIKKEKEDVKAAAEELENQALERYRELEEEEKQRNAEEENRQAEQEAFETFQRLDSNHDGKLQIAELQVRQTFDQNKDGAVSEDEAKFFMNMQEEMTWDDFTSGGWQRMKPFFMMDQGMFQPPTTESHHPDPDAEPSEQEPEYGEEDEYNKELEDGIDDPLDKALQDEEEDGEEEEEEEEEQAEKEGEAEQVEKKPQYDEETQRLIDEAGNTRSDFEEADRVVRDLEREIRQLSESLEKDYGIDEEFASLDGECFEYNDREYTYKLCPFDHATQKPKLGGAETRLGTWSTWIGSEENKYVKMLYDKGQSCWNGPQRSTQVNLICGTENQLSGVSEPNKCEYMFDFITPCICKSVEGVEERSHDEL